MLTPASMSAKGLVVPMSEYGNAVTTTALLRGTSMIPIDPLVAERVGYNAGESIDTIAGTALQAGSITYDTGVTENVQVVTDEDGLSSSGLREAVLNLQENNARPTNGSYWTLIASPRQIMALRGEVLTGPSNQGGWRDVTMWSEGTAGNNIFYGQVGVYEGVNIISDNHLHRPEQGDLDGRGGFRQGVQQRSRLRRSAQRGRVAGCRQAPSFRQRRLDAPGRLLDLPCRRDVHRHIDTRLPRLGTNN